MQTSEPMNRRDLFRLAGAVAIAVAVPVELGPADFTPIPKAVGVAPITFSLEEFSERVLRPAMQQLAAKLEADIFAGQEYVRRLEAIGPEPEPLMITVEDIYAEALVVRPTRIA